MKNLLVLLTTAMLNLTASAQLPYTTAQFQYDSLIDVSYGTAIDFAGNSTDLLMDIYKPIGDSNCLRPVIVLIHGGAWVSGSKEDPNLVYMSRDLAKKGWVVANINYRLGTHKASNYVMYAICDTNISAPCAYICDSSEIYRANFRGMQDAKGAIRFMKDRFLIDSSDINNVFVAGESAGGFVAFATAFTDQLSEKSADCFAISDAPTPSANLATYGCIPASNSLIRPDLGSIDGTLHLGIHDATVQGIGNFYGGVLNLELFQQTNNEYPVVYLFHQGSDIVVNYNYGILLGRTSWECYAQTNLCQSYFFYPYAHGSKSIDQHFQSLGATGPLCQTDIIENYSYLNNCFSNGHSIDNLTTRLQNMTDIFAAKIDVSGNDPATNCSLIGLNEANLNTPFSLFPNPANDQLTIQLPGNVSELQYTITDALGKTIFIGKLTGQTTTIDVSILAKGIYTIQVGNAAMQMMRWVKK